MWASGTVRVGQTAEKAARPSCNPLAAIAVHSRRARSACPVGQVWTASGRRPGAVALSDAPPARLLSTEGGLTSTYVFARQGAGDDLGPASRLNPGKPALPAALFQDSNSSRLMPERTHASSTLNRPQSTSAFRPATQHLSPVNGRVLAVKTSPFEPSGTLAACATTSGYSEERGPKPPEVGTASGSEGGRRAVGYPAGCTELLAPIVVH
jgi:hypothetical protein